MSNIKLKNTRFVMLEDYGISKSRLRELQALSKLEEYDDMAHSAACKANKDIAEHILLSVREGVSYDKLDLPKYKNKLGRICVSRTDFYGYRRLFYYIFDCTIQGEKYTRAYIISRRKNAKYDLFIHELTLKKCEGHYTAIANILDRKNNSCCEVFASSASESCIKKIVGGLAITYPPKEKGETGTVFDFADLLVEDC